jgi:hypothetical protein
MQNQIPMDQWRGAMGIASTSGIESHSSNSATMYLLRFLVETCSNTVVCLLLRNIVFEKKHFKEKKQDSSVDNKKSFSVIFLLRLILLSHRNK